MVLVLSVVESMTQLVDLSSACVAVGAGYIERDLGDDVISTKIQRKERLDHLTLRMYESSVLNHLRSSESLLASAMRAFAASKMTSIE